MTEQEIKEIKIGDIIELHENTLIRIVYIKGQGERPRAASGEFKGVVIRAGKNWILGEDDEWHENGLYNQHGTSEFDFFKHYNKEKNPEYFL